MDVTPPIFDLLYPDLFHVSLWNSIWSIPDPLTPDGTSFWVTYGDLQVANISNTIPVVFGKPATFKAVVPGDPNRKLLYQWDYMNPDFSLSQPLTLQHNSAELTTFITGPKILAVFVTDNSSSDPKPQAYNWTYVGSVNVTRMGLLGMIEPYSVP